MCRDGEPTGPAPVAVLCFGGEDWWYHNHGHFDMQMMRRFARMGCALYVNSIVMRKPVMRQGRQFLRCVARKARSIGRGLTRVDAGFFVYSPVSLPVHHLRWARRANQRFLARQVARVAHRLGMAEPAVWVACPAACEAAISLPRSILIYQRTDRFEDYPNVDADTIRAWDRTLKREADLTIFVNQSLYEREAGDCRGALLLDHGVDYDLFARAEENPFVPEDLRGIPRPIAGFFGAIDGHTFDLDLMEQVVEKRRDVSFVLVGKASMDCSRLAGHGNVHLLGQKRYERIPHYGKCFDVCLMPWRQNRWVEACNPVKLKEYLALGKPIVSTPFRELERCDGLVYVARDAEAFARLLERAIAEDDEGRRRSRRACVREETWDARAREALEALRAVRRGNQPRCAGTDA